MTVPAADTSQTRHELVASPHTFFQNSTQLTDLLDDKITQTGLIALFVDLIDTHGFYIEFTAVKSDHHDDSALGEHCHFNGYCADVWPLKSPVAGDYLDAADPLFKKFIEAVAASEWLYQVGLAGTAWISQNAVAGGDTVFHDDGPDHVHLGAK